MSTSPQDQQDEGVALDELDDANHVVDNEAEPSTATPAKRGRGRPKGSKNKGAPPSGSSAPPVHKKRGRPPKEKKEKEDDGEEPPPKRPRGRPPKKPSAGPSVEGEKKKRGRPPKKATT